MRFPSRSLTPPAAARGLWLDQTLASEPAAPIEPLESATSADVCIVGGGFTGLWTAIELKRRAPQTDVVVIEADICGGGASGRNGGFAMNWWPKFLTLQKRCGTEAALGLARRAEQAVYEIGRFCDGHGIDADFRQSGWLWTATNRAQMDAWSGTLTALERVGAEPFERLSREEVADRSGSPVHLGGIFERGAATVQPAALARGLAQAARKAGVRIHEGTPMTELSGGSPPVVRAPRGEVRARDVIVAINAWASMFPQVGRGLVVVSSDIVATRPIPDELASIGWHPGLAISDSRRLINYYRTSTDGRVVFGKGGGTVAMTGRMGPEYHGASPRAGEIDAQFRFIYPMLWEAPLERTWRGPIDYSLSGLPFFIRPADLSGVLIAAGFSGNGVGPARLAGELLAEMTTDGGDAGLPPVFTRVPRAPIPPEPIRYVGARIVRAAVARKEKSEDLGERPGALTRALAGLDPTSFTDRGAPANPYP